MTLYLTAEEAIGGNPAELVAAAHVLSKASDSADNLATVLQRAVDSTEASWRGKAGDAYRAHSGKQLSVAAKMPTPLSHAAESYRILAGELESAQRRAREAMAESTKLGLAEGDLVGRPLRVAAFVALQPDKFVAVSHLLADVVYARISANKARDHFVASMGSLRGAIAAAGGEDRRGPDERGGRRLRADEIFGRPKGGDRGGDNFDNDWAGRAILERYLRGGSTWNIVNDPKWTDYMEANQRLRDQLVGHAQAVAQGSLQEYLTGQGGTGSFGQRFHAEVENGEGIVGYQYLHGTDSSKGDFGYKGDTTVRPQPDGTYEVKIHGNYTWNDTIDPNPQYSTDRWKSGLAEILTLGQADPYDMHIAWTSDTTVTLDKNGNVIRMKGYPAP